MGFHGGGWFVYMRSDEKARPRVTWPLIRRVLGYARPYRLPIVALLFLILITALLGLITPLIFRDLIDYTLPQGDAGRLNWLALGLVALPILGGGVRVIQRKLNATVGEGVIYDLRVALYDHMQRMSLRFFTHTKTGELMSRLNNDVVDAQRAISNTIVDIITNIITVAVTLGVMLAMEWRLTVLGILVLPVFIMIARRLGGVLRDISRRGMELNAQMNAMMNETLNISGALLVKLFGQRKNEVARFKDRSSKVRDVGVERAVVGSQFFVLIGLVSAVGTALVYWVGGHLVLGGAFTIGTIVAFGAYLTQLYGPLQALVNSPVDFATSMVSFERVFEVVDLPLDIVEKPDAVVLSDVQGALVFEDVSFAYEALQGGLLSSVERIGHMDNVQTALSGQQGNGQKANGKSDSKPNGTNDRAARIQAAREKVAQAAAAVADSGEDSASQARDVALTGVSFSIAPGQLVALVGRSGAGKTTITYLIPRLYDPTAGCIRLDGHDLRDVTLDSLAAAIGMVTQETYLFNDTIRTNLLYAKADPTQAELEAACRAANIHDFIMGLPDGYDTVVGERGYRMSGGEKQRLALARVILKNPRVLVLDEATSHLDSESEALIQAALERVMEGRTSIVIAHRLSTILAADLILVLDRGQIVEQGTHADLLAQGGLYAQLYETQFKHMEHEVA